MTQEKYLISVVGPTAAGKTQMAIYLAKAFDTVIVSFDSRQFYKEMKIGTAVPSDEELLEVPHYFIQHLSIQNAYSVGTYEKDALSLLSMLFQKYQIVIFTGGSFLYQKAVLEGIDEFPEVSWEIRDQLNKEVEVKGLGNLVDELKNVDHVTFNEIDLQNPRRVIRALEVYRASGKKYSSFKNQEPKHRFFHSIEIGLELTRELLYERINARVEEMLKKGLIDEVSSLKNYQDYTALQTVGYKELFPYLDNKIYLDEAIELIKRNSRRYAKRQLTWLRKNNNINWVKPDSYQESADLIRKRTSHYSS